MSESTIDLRPDFNRNEPYNPSQERDRMQQMNSLSAQMAVGLSLNKSMDGKLTSMNMNMGKVAAGLNRLDTTMITFTGITKDMANKMSAINMNIGKTNARLDKIDSGIQQMVTAFKSGVGNRNTNMSIGNMSTRLVSMQKHQEETNKLLQQIFNTRRGSGSSKFEKLESDLEARSGDRLGDMSKTLVSIDNTLKAMLGRSGGGGGLQGGSSASGGGLLSNIGSGLAGMMARPLAPAILAGLAVFLADKGLGKLGAGGNKIDYDKDRENWDRMNWMNKVESSTARILENTIGLIAPNVRNSAQFARIRDESSYFAGIDADHAEEIEKKRKRFYGNTDPNRGSSWENNGRNGNPTHMDRAVADDVMNSYWDKKKRGIKYNSPIGPEMPSNLSFRATDIVHGGDSFTPFASTASFAQSNTLAGQNSETERRDKGITTGDMIYNAKDITYKATMIRFDAGTIMFSGGQGSGSSQNMGTSPSSPGSYPQNSGSTPQNYPAYQGGPTSDVLSSPARSEPSMSSGGSGGTYKKGSNTGKMSATASGAMETVINTLMTGDSKLGLKGMTRQEAELFTANFYSENKSFGTDPSQVGDKNIPGGSHGIGQWNRDRLDGLKNFAKTNGMNWEDPKTQALWTLQETQKGGKKDFYKRFQEAVSKGDVAGAYGLLRDKYEVGLKGGSNLENFNKGLEIVRGGSFSTYDSGPRMKAGEDKKSSVGGVISPVSGVFEGTPNAHYGAARGSYFGGLKQYGAKNRLHSGSDWKAPNGSNAVFPVNGKVIHTGNHAGYGATVDILGEDGNVYRMATHGSVGKFKVGQSVKQGDVAGRIASGHLHMEVIPREINGKPNPVYDEFVNQMESGQGRFVSTSGQRGTVNQAELFGVKKGTKVKLGEYIVPANKSVDASGSVEGGATPSIVKPRLRPDGIGGDKSKGMPSLGYGNFNAGGPENTAMAKILTDRAMGRLGYPADSKAGGDGSVTIGKWKIGDDSPAQSRIFPQGGGMSFNAALPSVSADKVSEFAPKSDWWGNFGIDNEAESAASMTSDLGRKAVSRSYEAGRNAIAAKRRALLDQANERAEMARRSRDNTERAKISANGKNVNPSPSTAKADEKTTMHSALNRHGDWYKQFAAQIRS